MKRIVLAAVVFALVAPVFAQQPQQSPMEQALSQRLSAEIGINIQSAAVIIDLRQQLAAAQARIKELEAAAPKKD